MDAVLDTLFYAVEEASGGAFPENRTLFIGGRFHPSLRRFDSNRIVIQQHFKPYESLLKRESFSVTPDMPEGGGDGFDMVMVLAPKNITEARFFLAQAFRNVRNGGIVLCAADNKAGGNRLEKMLQQFGVSPGGKISKNHAKAVYAPSHEVDERAVDEAIEAGRVQNIENGRYLSQPGVFSWNRVDRGSELLSEFLPEELIGVCGDFGCGYGYLSRRILERHQGIQEMVCADADYRALNLCKENLKNFSVRKRFVWEDLTRKCKSLYDLDVIVMNPPFHKGRNTEAEIGRGFIATAREALRRGGHLYMVANRHLPYETLLRELFTESTMLHEREGYKVFFAVR